MNENLSLLVMGWIGLYAPVALGAIGAAIGCTIAGQAAIGAMMEINGLSFQKACLALFQRSLRLRAVSLKMMRMKKSMST